jgi:hypothetical protein
MHSLDSGVVVHLGSAVHTADACSRERGKLLPPAVPTGGSGHRHDPGQLTTVLLACSCL